MALGAISCQPGRTPVTVSGTIECDEARLASRYGGRVERLFVTEGAFLTNGQVLVELDAAELCARREQIAALLAELEAGPRPEEISVARAEWQALHAQLVLAQTEACRAAELRAAQTISQTEYDRAAAQAEALEKSVAAAHSRLGLLLAGTRPERIRQVRAQLAELEAQLREMRVLAPTNCVLEVLSARVGDVLPPNREVATVLLNDHLYARVFVPAPWLGRLAVGDRITVRVDAFPGREFPGEVEFVGRAAEFTPRNVQTIEERLKQVYPVKVRLAATARELRPGMTMELVLPSNPN